MFPLCPALPRRDPKRPFLLLTLLWIALHCSPRAGDHPIVFSTYFGGSFLDSFEAVTTDAAGNIYCAGWSWSTNFPTLKAFQSNLQGASDAVLAKFDPAGNLIFSTYFGGSSEDGIESIFLNTNGDIWVTGFAHSTDLPATEGAFQMEYGGGSAFGNGDGFIARFSNDGSALLYCSYFGGSGDDIALDIQLKSDGGIVICGTTDSPNFPGAILFGTRGGQDGYVAQFDSSGARLLSTVLIAGEGAEESLRLDLANDGGIFFCGATYSTNFFTTENAQDRLHQPAWRSRDGFFGILDLGTTNLNYLSLFGAGSDEGIFDLAVRRDGSVVITGVNGTYWSATNRVFQPQPGFGPEDAFVAVLRPPEWDFEWFSYLGGSAGEAGYKLALDSEENILITGETDSKDFPLRDPLTQYGGGEADPFVVKVSRDGSTLLYSTFLGGASNDRGWDVAAGPDGSVILVGWAASGNFPLRNAFQSSIPDRDVHAYVTKILPGPVPYAAPPLPPIEIARSGTRVVVSWPENIEGVSLESSPVVKTLHWTPVSGSALSLGGKKAMILNIESATRFFRLRQTQTP